jgi:hypothetical protein
MDDVSAKPEDSAFYTRVREIVLERFGSPEPFEKALNVPAGFFERELMSGGLPLEMVAQKVAAVVHCRPEWLLTGDGERFNRKAPLPPPEPEVMPDAALSPAEAATVKRRPPASALRTAPTVRIAPSNPPGPPAPAPATSDDGPTGSLDTPPSDLPTQVDAGGRMSGSRDTERTEPLPDVSDDPFSVRIPAGGSEDSGSADATSETRVPAPGPKSAPSSPRLTPNADWQDSTIVSSASERPSRVDLPVVPRRELNAEDSTENASDSILINAVETDRDAERAMVKAIEQFHYLLRVPPELPEVDTAVKLQPARRIAAEFFDFITLPNDRGIAIVTACLAGAGGLQSWGDVAMAMRSMRIFARSSETPREVLIKTNSELVPVLTDDSSLTVLFSVFDPKKRTLTVAQSGHPPLLIYNPKRTQPLISVKPGGMVLGLVRGARFENLLQEETHDLLPGDTLLWFSEGLPATQNIKGDELGVDGIGLLMRGATGRNAQEFLDFVLDQAHHWRGGVTASQDLTGVVMKIEESLDDGAAPAAEDGPPTAQTIRSNRAP